MPLIGQNKLATIEIDGSQFDQMGDRGFMLHGRLVFDEPEAFTCRPEVRVHLVDCLLDSEYVVEDGKVFATFGNNRQELYIKSLEELKETISKLFKKETKGSFKAAEMFVIDLIVFHRNGLYGIYVLSNTDFSDEIANEVVSMLAAYQQQQGKTNDQKSKESKENTVQSS